MDRSDKVITVTGSYAWLRSRICRLIIGSVIVVGQCAGPKEKSIGTEKIPEVVCLCLSEGEKIGLFTGPERKFVKRNFMVRSEVTERAFVIDRACFFRRARRA